MCESCNQKSGGATRRDFLVASALSSTVLASPLFCLQAGGGEVETLPARKKEPAHVKVVFLYLLAKDCDANTAEVEHYKNQHWHPYPGYQWNHEQQQARYAKRVAEMAERIGMELDVLPQPLTTDKEVAEYITRTKPAKKDAVLIFVFSKDTKKKAQRIIQELAVPAIVYMPAGANHNDAKNPLYEEKRTYFIKSIENFDEIDRALRTVHARKMLSQSRVVGVGGTKKIVSKVHEAIGFEYVGIPATMYDKLFDSIDVNAVRDEAMAIKNKASRVLDVTDKYILDALLAYKTVGSLTSQFGADALAVECLSLGNRKPCVSFMLHNDAMKVSCVCQYDLHSTVGVLLGRYLFRRPGFVHNPEFDNTRNQYLAVHCTCATKLQGPDGPEQPFMIRPFFHQLPKSACVDVQWPKDAAVMLYQYSLGRGWPVCDFKSVGELHYKTGRVLYSPECPPVGGCATRVLVEIDDLTKPIEDEAYWGGPHAVLTTIKDRDEARCLDIYKKLYLST